MRLLSCVPVSPPRCRGRVQIQPDGRCVAAVARLLLAAGKNYIRGRATSARCAPPVAGLRRPRQTLSKTRPGSNRAFYLMPAGVGVAVLRFPSRRPKAKSQRLRSNPAFYLMPAGFGVAVLRFPSRRPKAKSQRLRIGHTQGSRFWGVVLQ